MIGAQLSHKFISPIRFDFSINIASTSSVRLFDCCIWWFYTIHHRPLSMVNLFLAWHGSMCMKINVYVEYRDMCTTCMFARYFIECVTFYFVFNEQQYLQTVTTYRNEIIIFFLENKSERNRFNEFCTDVYILYNMCVYTNTCTSFVSTYSYNFL